MHKVNLKTAQDFRGWFQMKKECHAENVDKTDVKVDSIWQMRDIAMIVTTTLYQTLPEESVWLQTAQQIQS